jgi:glycosyltransferase involved in cell wall biosynthesis
LRLGPKVIHLPAWYPNRIDPQLGVFIRKHVQAVAQHSHSELIYTKKLDDLKGYEIEEHDLEDFREIIVYYSSGFGKLTGLYRRQKALQKGLARCQIKKPDFVHLHVLDRNAILGFRLAQKLNVPYGITEHWTGYRSGAFAQKNTLEKSMLRKIARNAAFIAPVSNALAEDMMKCDIEGNYTTIPNVLKPAIQSKTKWNPTFHFGVIADLVDHQKNISSVIRAFSEIEFENMRLTIVGDGPDAHTLKALAMGSSNPIEFAGRWDNNAVLRNMSQFDALIVNSRIETFSVVTLEALSAGVPVIATKSGGPEEFIDESNGITIDVDDQKRLKEAMIFFLDKPNTFNFQEIAEKTRKKYDERTIGDQYAQLYRNAIMR